MSIEWKKFYGTDFQRITLPQYPWQREKHWVSPARDKGGNINNKRLDGTKGHPLLMNYAAIATAPTTHIWQSNISVSQFQYLENHIVEEAITLPAALYLEAFFAAGKEVFENLDFVLKKIKFSNAISLLPEQNIMLQIALEQNIGNNYNISLNYWNTNDNAWIECASAQIANKSNEKIIEDALSLEIAQSICTETISHIQHYEKTASIGLPYSGVFRSVTQILSSENMALGKIKSDDSLSSSLNKYIFHPTILDGCLQVLLSEIYDHPNASTFVPTSIDAIRYYTKEPISEASSLVKIVSESHNKISADIQIFDNNQKILAELKNITFDRLISTGDTSNIDNIYFEVLWNKIEIQTQKLEVSDCVLIGKGDYTKELSKKLNIAFSTTFDTTIKNKNIIYAVPLDSPQEAVYTENDILPLVDIIKNRVNANIETKIFVLTKGAYQIDKDTNILPLSSMFTGFHRVFCNELPEFKPTLIDISLNSYNLELLEKVLSYNGTENEFCIRNDIFVSRLNRITHNEFDQFCPIQKVDYFEAITTPGILENIKIIQKYLPPPKKEEVQIKIESVGINFMNLMSALGIYPGKKDGFATLGIELVGTITQIGAETSLHKIGDKVMGMGYHTMASHTNVNENAVIAIPKNISTEDASTMPVAYLTAYYSIVHLGKLQKGEQILIHSATGGVGLAAIYIAKSLGAEIFATAGSAEKRRYLKESLGIQHVYDSRNNDFYAQIKKDVEGKGLDMVLNSLSGEQMWYSLKLLGSFGRFVEIGKKDVYNNSKLGLEVFQHGLSYFMVDFEKILFEKPQLIQFLLLEINANIVKGEYLPLPVKRFSIDKIIHAFDEMSKANTIGKIVVDINNKNLHLFKNLSDLQIDSLGTYLLTGGYGGLGLVFAQYLAEKGAKKIILTGRSAPSKNALSLINQLVENGVDVKIEQVDVTDAVAVNNLISKIESPLRGIFHLAGVLDDSSIANYDTQKYLNTIKPKVWGATHLHESTKHLDLDYFVLFSSSAVLFGSPGQSAYASANSYMDALAIHRKNLGLAATSINFGTVSDVGLAAAENNRAERLADEGISPLNATDCIKIFEMAIKTQKTVLGAFHFDVDLWQKTYRSAAENPFLSALKNNDQKETPEQKLSLLATLQSITDQQELLTLIEEKIKDKVGLVVKLSPEKIASKTNFKSLGIDSLMSIQLKNQLENQFNTSITVTSFWTYATIKDYAIFLAEKLNLIKKDVPVVDIKEKQKKEPSPPSVENIDVSNISDDDFLNLLANELEDI